MTGLESSERSRTRLTKAVLIYKRTGKNKQSVMNMIYTLVYTYPVKNLNLAEDEAAEFLIYFLSTIDKMIESFRYTGFSFERYLIHTIKYKLRTFRYNQYRKAMLNHAVLCGTEYTRYSEKMYDTVCNDNTPIYTIEHHPKNKNMYNLVIRPNQDTQPSTSCYKIKLTKILHLLLLYSLQLPPSIADELDSVWKNEKYQIAVLLHEINKRNQKKAHTLRRLETRRNQMFSELIYLEIQQRLETEEERMEEIRTRIERKRAALSRVQHQICTMNKRATHRLIAEVLNIPKGSVDSSLYYFRKNYKTLLDDFR